MLGVADAARRAVGVELLEPALLAEGDLRRHAARRGPEEVADALALGARDVPAARARRPASCVCTVGRPRLSRPARSSSPRMAMMPPARCTSSICTSATDGATLQSTAPGATGGRCPAMVKSHLALIARRPGGAAPCWSSRPWRCRAPWRSRSASKLAMLRGSTRLVVLLVVAPREVDDQVAGLDEQPLAVGVRRQHRAVAGQRQAERLGQAVHRVGGEHARARAAGRAGRALDHLDVVVADLVVGGGDHGVDQVDRA